MCISRAALRNSSFSSRDLKHRANQNSESVARRNRSSSSLVRSREPDRQRVQFGAGGQVSGVLDVGQGIGQRFGVELREEIGVGSGGVSHRKISRSANGKPLQDLFVVGCVAAGQVEEPEVHAVEAVAEPLAYGRERAVALEGVTDIGNAPLPHDADLVLALALGDARARLPCQVATPVQSVKLAACTHSDRRSTQVRELPVFLARS